MPFLQRCASVATLHAAQNTPYRAKHTMPCTLHTPARYVNHATLLSSFFCSLALLLSSPLRPSLLPLHLYPDINFQVMSFSMVCCSFQQCAPSRQTPACLCPHQWTRAEHTRPPRVTQGRTRTRTRTHIHTHTHTHIHTHIHTKCCLEAIRGINTFVHWMELNNSFSRILSYRIIMCIIYLFLSSLPPLLLYVIPLFLLSSFFVHLSSPSLFLCSPLSSRLLYFSSSSPK